MQRAAKLRGMTLTGYLIATAGEDARRTVEEADVLRLTAEDQARFAKALIDPPVPNARLKRAAKRHADLIAPRVSARFAIEALAKAPQCKTFSCGNERIDRYFRETVTQDI